MALCWASGAVQDEPQEEDPELALLVDLQAAWLGAHRFLGALH